MKPDDKDAIVAEFFSKTDNYLSNNVIKTIRGNSLRCFSGDRQYVNAIDIACGDGTVSLGIANNIKALTLLDISAEMLDIAARNLQTQKQLSLHLIHHSFLSAKLPPNNYDLVICSGLLAHISEPEKCIQKIGEILKPGGFLFLQNTDAGHPYSFLVRTYHKLKSLVIADPYPLNKVFAKDLHYWCSREGFVLKHNYASLVSFLFLSRLISAETKLRIISFLFGHPGKQGCRFLGNDHLYFFEKRINESKEQQ